MKRIVFAAAAAALAAGFAATPAAATQGLNCRPVSGTGPSIDIVTGLGLVSVSVTERGVTLSTMAPAARLAARQSWFDEQRVWIDLTDPNHMHDEGKLRLAYVGSGRARHLAGAFVRAGRLTRVRCQES
jgi:hypothetical protein